MGSHLAETIPQFQQNEYVFQFRFTSPFSKTGAAKATPEKIRNSFFLHDMHAYYATYILRMTDKRLRRYAHTGTIYS